MKTYLCLVCSHHKNGICVKNPSLENYLEECKYFLYSGYVEFVKQKCPTCGREDSVFQDNIGASCAIPSCTFRQDYKHLDKANSKYNSYN